MDAERLRMRLGIIQSENEMALVQLKKKDIPEFVASVGEFDFTEEDNKITLLRNDKTTDFPVEGDSFTTYIKNIASVFIYEE
jgi:hypothetical protein